MCDGKQRQRALEDFDLNLTAPEGGWEQAERDLERAIRVA